MDVVYPLARNQGLYNELRYSLRSLTNLPHRDVFLVGGKPDWYLGQFIETELQPTKYKDSTNNVKAACLDDRVSDPFVLMNDDFFVVEPSESVPTLNRGRALDVLRHCDRAGRKYSQGARDTLRVLRQEGYEDPLSFELHVPLVVHKSYMLAAIRLGQDCPTWHKRTAYGALAGLQGDTVPDVKVYDRKIPIPTGPFVSTQDESFQIGRVGRQLKTLFPEPSQYETS